MANLLAEQPIIIAVMLAATGMAMLLAWLQTGKKTAAVVGGLFFFAIPGVFVIASNWETDREQIERIIYETADAVERNDFEDVYELIGDAGARRMAEQELPNFEFAMARVNKMRSITTIESPMGSTGEAELSVKVDVSSKRGGIRNVRVVRKLLLRFEKQGDRWVVTDYKHMPIVGGPDGFSTP